MRIPDTSWHSQYVLFMVEMNSTQFLFICYFEFVLSSCCMFQQESGHGIMWAYNNADAAVGLFLILIVKMDLAEWSLWTKHKACRDSFPRYQYSLHYCCDIWVWAVWITNVLSDKCHYEQQHWLMWTPLFNVLVSVSGHCTVSSIICLNRPTGSVIPHWHSCTSIWVYTLCFSTLSWVPLCPKYSDRILYLTFNSQLRQIVHQLPPLK